MTAFIFSSIPWVKRRPKPHSFPFSSIPWTIQNRFIEICDTPTLSNFARINLWTLKLSKKRIQSVNTVTFKSKNDFKNIPELFEIKEYLTITLNSKVSLADVSNIIPSYSVLWLLLKNFDIKALKHFILGPNLKYFSLLTKVVYENIDEVKEFVEILLKNFFERFSISIFNNDPTKNLELRKAFKPLINKYQNKGNTFNFYITDLVYPD